MAVVNNGFFAAIDAWTKESDARLEAVFRESTQRLANQVTLPISKEGNMPVVTGFLRSSLQASTTGAVPMNKAHKPEKDKTYTPDGSVSLVIARLTIGQTIWLTFTAIYARAQEYGLNGRPGKGFVRLAAQRWQQIVAQVAAELRARSGGWRCP